MKTKTTHVGIIFNTKKMSKKQRDAIYHAEALLGEAGIIFGSSVGTEDNGDPIDIVWDLDFDLSGPARVDLRAYSALGNLD